MRGWDEVAERRPGFALLAGTWLFAGVLATFGSELTVFGLETQIFQIDYTAHPSLWILGPAIGIVLLGTVGTFATRRVVSSPPNLVLRELA